MYFPSLYALPLSKETWVTDFWDETGVCGGGAAHWNPHLSRHFKTFFFCFQDYKISW